MIILVSKLNMGIRVWCVSRAGCAVRTQHQLYLPLASSPFSLFPFFPQIINPHHLRERTANATLPLP